MASGKKKKISDEDKAFQKEWISSYFLVEISD